MIRSMQLRPNDRKPMIYGKMYQGEQAFENERSP